MSGLVRFKFLYLFEDLDFLTFGPWVFGFSDCHFFGC